VLTVYHPEGEVINSVIIARKEDAHANGLQNGRAHAKGAMPIASNAADEESCKIEASALQKREEMVAAEEQLAF
jgi:nicotianamine synthase